MENERIEVFFKKLGEDKEFAEKIFKEENEKEDVQTIAKEAGIELSLEEIVEAREIIVKVLDKQKEGELSDDDLESVAGGFLIVDTVVATVLVATYVVGKGW